MKYKLLMKLLLAQKWYHKVYRPQLWRLIYGRRWNVSPQRQRLWYYSNVNIGTNGAEIGGAFGGEKLIGGRKAAVMPEDLWTKQTNTINYNSQTAIGRIQFDL